MTTQNGSDLPNMPSLLVSFSARHLRVTTPLWLAISSTRIVQVPRAGPCLVWPVSGTHLVLGAGRREVTLGR